MDQLELMPYVFTRGQRGIFAEVYFPKKVAYQPEIFRALKNGLKEADVKNYLRTNLFAIRSEMKDYLQIFDPSQYRRHRWIENPEVSPLQAEKRINRYKSPFYGWSMYEVDGTFRGNRGKLYDERTQIVRLIFRLEHRSKRQAKAEKCYDVFEAMVRWILAEQGRLDHVFPWNESERKRFLELHGIWSAHKLDFVERNYEQIARVVKKWIDDIALFIFGYLIRKFWVEISKQGYKEDEIWVASFFNVNLNIVKQQKRRKENK